MFKKILVPIDGSEGSSLAIDHCITLLQKDQPDKIVLLHVAKFPSQLRTYSGKMRATFNNIKENLEDYGNQVLGEAAQKIQSGGADVEIETKFIWGDPPYDIVEQAEEEDCDLIIIGSRGLDGVKSLLLGSVSNYVTRNAHCTVMVTRPE